MNKLIMTALIAITTSTAFAQKSTTEITRKNSWLKAGVVAGVPVGNTADVSNFTAGIDLKGQIMSTPHLGVGLVTGYNHFFAKKGFKDFGTIPLGMFLRYYPKEKGFFAGTDVGYSFVTNTINNKGGFYVRPQIGYHNYSWNFFGYYNPIFRSNFNGGNIQHLGIGATYNIHFN